MNLKFSFMAPILHLYLFIVFSVGQVEQLLKSVVNLNLNIENAFQSGSVQI